MNKTAEKKHPFNGFFGFVGGLVGFSYAISLSDHPLVVIGGLIVGIWLGLIVENLIFRLIIIGLAVLMIVARGAFFDAILDSAQETNFIDAHRFTYVSQGQPAPTVKGPHSFFLAQAGEK